MPLAGLLRDGSPEARLRIRRCACICHRQRLALDLQRKATRGSVLWTPRRSGEAKGKTRVAARAVRRGLEPRIPLTLKHTSDRDEPPPLPAARENMHNKKPRHCEPVTDVTGVAIRLFSGGRGRPAWILYQMCTVFGIRANDLTLCKMLPAFGALFSLESKNRFSFRARPKREMGLDLRRSDTANTRPPRRLSQT